MNKFLYNLLEIDCAINNKYIYNDSLFNKYSFKENNNDSFQYVLMIFLYIELFFHLIYSFIIYFLILIKKFINKMHIPLILILFLFKYPIICKDNSQIPTNLIISSFFRKKNIVKITFETIKNKEIKKEVNNFHNNYKGNNNTYNDCMNKNNNNINSNVNILNKNYLNEKKSTFNKLNKKKKKIQEKEITNNINNNEIILDNYPKIKNILIIIFSFLFMFIFIMITYKKKKSFLILYLLFLFISYNLMKILYQNEYYIASNLIYILFIYINKKLIDALYLLLKFKRKDFEIFSTNLSAINRKQLILKTILLFYLTFLSAIFSVVLFTSWFNYIIYFLCLLSILSFLGNTLDLIFPYNLKPVKNMIIFIVGIINFLLSKYILKYYIFQNNNNNIINNNFTNIKFNCFYLINDLFSIYCLSYINGYIKYQLELFPIKNILEYRISYTLICFHYFKINYFLLILFFISAFISYLGIYKNEFICFYISLYLFYIITNFLPKIYNKKICIIINYFIFIYFLIYIPRFSGINDYYMTNLILPKLFRDKEFFAFLNKSIFLIILFYCIIKNHFIFSSVSKSNEQNKKKQNNNYLNINISELSFYFVEIVLHFIIICLLCLIYKYYENKLIFKFFYIIIIIIFHLLKLSSIVQYKEKSNNNKITCYNNYFFVWIIISLRLIILSGKDFSVIRFVHHANLIYIINFFIKNENIYFKILLIAFLFASYSIFNSIIFILDIYIILIYAILNIEYQTGAKDRKNLANINLYIKFTLIILLLVLFVVMLKILCINKKFNECFEKLICHVDNFINNNDNIDKNIDINEGIEFFIMSKLINHIK